MFWVAKVYVVLNGKMINRYVLKLRVASLQG
jgi:hypothetical protein